MKALLDILFETTKRNKRLFIWVIGVLTIFFSLHFSFRVFVSRDDELRQFSAPEVRPLATSVGIEAIRARLDVALPAPPSPQEVAAAQPREIALQGVFVSKRRRIAALVLLPQGEKPLERKNLEVGGEIDGWTVEVVAATTVTLKKGSETQELVMFRGR